MTTTGYDPVDFARSAYKVAVDIDPYEVRKLDRAIDLGLCADAKVVINALIREAHKAGEPPIWNDPDGWYNRCLTWKRRYPLITAPRTPNQEISTYDFADALSDLISPTDVLAPCSSGSAIEIFFLALRLHTGQRLIFNPALGAMGYGTPTAIGACIASDRRRTICVDGDGGLHLNAQELQTIARLQLPIKLFVLSNDGYASIRASQQRWFGRLTGADSSSGLTLPPLSGVAAAYGLPYVRLDGDGDISSQLKSILETDGPLVCEVPTPRDEPRSPSQTSEALPDGSFRSRPLEDLAPLLDREELAREMSNAPSEDIGL